MPFSFSYFSSSALFLMLALLIANELVKQVKKHLPHSEK